MNVGIVARPADPRAVELADGIARLLEDRDVAVAVEEATAEAVDGAGVPVERMAACDLVVSIGGDGTFLFAARGAGTTPVMGVNLGEVGFLNAVPPGNALEAVRGEVRRAREAGSPRTRRLARLRAAGDGWSAPPAINEVAILGPRRGRGGGLGVEVRVDGGLYTSGHADGLLVATPTGSTAYNLSEGGPLVHYGTDGFVVAEMAPAGGMPPLVVAADSEVAVRVENADKSYVVADGQVRERRTPPETITVERAGEPLNVAGPPLDFFAALGKLD